MCWAIALTITQFSNQNGIYRHFIHATDDYYSRFIAEQ